MRIISNLEENDMNNQLVKTNDLDTSIADIEKTNKICSLLMKTSHYAKLGQEGIYAIVAKARAMNLDPVEALNGALYFVKGKVGMSAEMMAALARQAGHSVTKDEKSTSTCCILHGKRKDNGDIWTVSFSIEDAKRAGIYQEAGPWGKYPDVMCYNRAMSKLFRQLFPDLSKGVGYVLDELQEITSPSYMETKEEKVLEIISKEQAEELCEIFKECEPKYVDSVFTTLKKSPINVENIENLPLNLFDRIKIAALRNRETYLSSLKDAQAEMIQEAAANE